MNAIDAALRHIRARLPKQILEAAFVSGEQGLFRTPTTLERAITDKVIDDFVIPDLNQFGQLEDIPLDAVGYDTVDFYTRVYHIPGEFTEGRPIVSGHIAARTITTGQHGLPPTALHFNGSRSSVLNATQQVTMSHSTVPSTVTTEVEVLGPSVVKIRDPGQFTSQMTLRARMGFHDTLGEIKPPFHGDFAKLVEYAVRRYCYVNLSMEVDLTRLHHGMEFGRFKDWIEQWSDSDELYEEQLKVMSRCLVHNDDKAARGLRNNGGRFKT